jgi:hypothetical protein
MKNGVAKINNSLNGYQIVIPSKTNNFMLFFGPIYLATIYFVFFEFSEEFNFKGISSLTDLDISSIIWTLGFTFGFIYAVIALLWSYFGKETLTIDRKEVQLEKSILGIGKKIKMKSSVAMNFRFHKMEASQKNFDLWKIFSPRTGKIHFDNGLITYGFGISIDDPEAKYLIQEIEKRIGNYNG